MSTGDEDAGAGVFHRITPSVFATEADPIVVGPNEIAWLTEASHRAPTKRARLLLHPHIDDNLHEMVIALPASSCDHPHINRVSAKSFLPLSGRFAVMVFETDGTQHTANVLSAGPWPGYRLIRLQKPAWHTIIPLDGDVVFLETIIGPFRGNQFAPWFPEVEDTRAYRAAADGLRRSARQAADALDSVSSM